MKNFLKILAIALMLMACGRSVFAATSTGSLNISATVAGGCGDGAVGPGEQCDNGSANGVCPAACSAACTVNSCGGPTPPPPPPPQSLTITNVSAAPACTSAVISWQTELEPSSTPEATAGYVQYWLDSDPGNVMRADATSSQALQSLVLDNLTLLGNYGFHLSTPATAA